LFNIWIIVIDTYLYIIIPIFYIVHNRQFVNNDTGFIGNIAQKSLNSLKI